MRGRPLLEWLLFAAVWALLLIPLRHATGTGGRTVAEPRDAAADTGSVPAWLRVVFSEPPEAFSFYSGGNRVWHQEPGSEEMEHLVDIVMRSGGPDLELEAQWTAEARRAVELVLEPVEGRAWHAVLWSRDARMRERVGFR